MRLSKTLSILPMVFLCAAALAPASMRMAAPKPQPIRPSQP